MKEKSQTSPVETFRDTQKVIFIEKLRNSLKRQEAKALGEYKKLRKLAASYINDGLSEKECVELLMIDGLTREASESYTSMAMSKKNEDAANEYSFRFEDAYGKVWSSYDIGKVIFASSEKEAWEKAGEFLDDEGAHLEPEKIVSVDPIE